MNRHSTSNEENKGDGPGIRLLQLVVRLMVPARVREEFIGDLLEEWSSSVVPRRGKLRGVIWLCSQLLRSLLPMARVWVRGFFLGDNAMFQRHNVPTSVKTVAAASLVFVVLNVGVVVFAIATANEHIPLLVTGGLFKVMLFIAITVGLLNLSEGFRKLMVFLTGISLITFPIAFSAFAISSDVFLEFAEFSVVKSRLAMEILLAILFASFLWIFITLRRPDVKRVFESGGQETLAT